MDWGTPCPWTHSLQEGHSAMKKLLAFALLAVFALSTQAFAKKTYVNGIDPN